MLDSFIQPQGMWDDIFNVGACLCIVSASGAKSVLWQKGSIGCLNAYKKMTEVKVVVR